MLASRRRGLAPSAARIPISRRRWVTVNDIIEKIPAAERSRTLSVTTASDAATSRMTPCPWRKTSSMVRTLRS